MNKSLSQSLSLCCIKCCVNLCRGFWFCFCTSFTLICMAELLWFFQLLMRSCSFGSRTTSLVWFLGKLICLWNLEIYVKFRAFYMFTFNLLALRNFWNSFPFTVGVFAAQVAGEIRNFEKFAKSLKFPNPYKHPLKSRIWEEVILSNELIRDGISVFSSRATCSFCCSYILYCCLSKVPE